MNEVKAGTTATAAAQKTGNYAIVSSLEKGEISEALVATTTAATIAKAGEGLSTVAAALSTGDSVTIGGVTTKATAETPAAAKAGIRHHCIALISYCKRISCFPGNVTHRNLIG